MLEAIYHPYYMPEKNWYKIQLLLWDNIYRIVPNSVENSFGDVALSEKWEVEPKYLQTRDVILPNEEYFNLRKDVIIKQLQKLSLVKKTHRYHTDRHYHLNINKIPNWVGEKLLDLNLRRRESVGVYGGEHYSVREDASNFLMSCLAHSFSIRENLSPLTNIQSSCFVTYGNQIGVAGQDQPEGENIKSTITGVFKYMVPKDITKLSFNEVIDIRDEYYDLRQGTRRCIEKVTEEYSLDKVIDTKRSQDLIKSAVSDYESDVEKFKKGTWRRVFKGWQLQTFGTAICTVGGYLAGGPVVASIAASLGGGISITSQIANRNESSDIDKSIQYFSKINKALNLKEFHNSFLDYENLIFFK